MAETMRDQTLRSTPLSSPRFDCGLLFGRDVLYRSFVNQSNRALLTSSHGPPSDVDGVRALATRSYIIPLLFCAPVIGGALCTELHHPRR